LSSPRLDELLGHFRLAAQDGRDFVNNPSRETFLTDRRTQSAVVMRLVVVGEAAGKIMDRFPDFVADHPEVPWRSMRGMRNRIAHGYFDIDLDLVWETTQTALPALLDQLLSLRSKL
jgi:uncharacterized protein with HEPN domain